MNASSPLQSINSFQVFWRLGYCRLVPIVPPGAEVSEHSTLFKRKDARGKAVGIRGRDGLWRGFDWIPYEADEADLPRWQEMGAGIGIKTGRVSGTEYTLIALDADASSEEHAVVIRDAIECRFGRLPIRVGRFPKALYLLRVRGDFQYTRIEFGERNERGDLTERVEVLSDGRQFVAQGIHPGTMQPYTWPRPIVHIDMLPLVDGDQVHALLEDLRPLLPAASPIIKEGSTAIIDQASLRGDPETVRRAVAAIPNTSAAFPSRESYRDMGYAIKAAIPDEREAFEIFSEWCGRWQNADGRENDPDIVEADWRRMKPPFRRGAGWLYELAEQHAPEQFSMASVWFSPIAEEPASPFEAAAQAEQRARESTYFEPLTLSEVFSRPPPKWVIDRHVPERGVGFLYGDPGTGKSFIALDMALHLAFGRSEWHGDRIAQRQDGVVVYLAAEGAAGFRARARAWLERNGVPLDEAGEPIDPRFRLIPQSVNFMQPDDIEKLVRTVRDVVQAPASMIVVDTVSRSMPGADENLQKDMTLFVKACDRLRDAFGCVVLGVHHAGKSGDMRGSTVLRGAGDFVFKLERKPGVLTGYLHCEKQKDAPDGWSDAYRFDVVTAGEGETSLVPSRCAAPTIPTALVEHATSSAILHAMHQAWEEGAPWSRAINAGERRAEHIVVATFGVPRDRAKDLLALWEGTGVIAYRNGRSGHAGRRSPGYEVLSLPEASATPEPAPETDGTPDGAFG